MLTTPYFKTFCKDVDCEKKLTSTANKESSESQKKVTNSYNRAIFEHLLAQEKYFLTYLNYMPVWHKQCIKNDNPICVNILAVSKQDNFFKVVQDGLDSYDKEYEHAIHNNTKPISIIITSPFYSSGLFGLISREAKDKKFETLIVEDIQIKFKEKNNIHNKENIYLQLLNETANQIKCSNNKTLKNIKKLHCLELNTKHDISSIIQKISGDICTIDPNFIKFKIKLKNIPKPNSLEYTNHNINCVNNIFIGNNAKAEYLKVFNIKPRSFPLESFLLTNQYNDIKGGILFYLDKNTKQKILYIESLWISDDFKGLKLSKQLMRLTEAYALDKGCTISILDTMNYQAPKLYKKLGYNSFNTFSLGGHTDINFKKNIKKNTGVTPFK